MTREDEQKALLDIVSTWNPSEWPEYRGFRCANCQQYRNEAWYHWVNSGNFKLPIHLCDDLCEPNFQAKILKINENKRTKIDRNTFGNTYKYSEKALKRFREIVHSWPEYKKPELKAFTCDQCNQTLTMEQLPDGTQQRQGYHVWWKMDDGKTLAELHFHKDCGRELDIRDKAES